MPKAWVPVVGEILLYQMVQANIVDNWTVTVIKKPKAVGYLMDGKKRKVGKNCIFFLEADTINLVEVEITGITVTIVKGLVPWKIKFTGSKALLNKLKEVLKQLH